MDLWRALVPPEYWCFKGESHCWERQQQRERESESLLLTSHCNVWTLGTQKASDTWIPNTLASVGPRSLISSYDCVVLMLHPSDVQSSVLSTPTCPANTLHLIFLLHLENTIEESSEYSNTAKTNIGDRSANVTFCRKKNKKKLGSLKVPTIHSWILSKMCINHLLLLRQLDANCLFNWVDFFFFFLKKNSSYVTQKTRGSISVEPNDACFALNFKWRLVTAGGGEGGWIQEVDATLIGCQAAAVGEDLDHDPQQEENVFIIKLKDLD